MSARAGRSASATSGVSSTNSQGGQGDIKALRDRVEDVARQVRELKRIIDAESAVAKKQTVLASENRKFIEAEERRADKWATCADKIIQRHRDRSILQLKQINGETRTIERRLVRSETSTKVTCTPGRQEDHKDPMDLSTRIQGSHRGSKVAVRGPGVAMTPRSRDAIRERERQLTQTLLNERNERLRRLHASELTTREEARRDAEERRAQQKTSKSRDKLESMLQLLQDQLSDLMSQKRHATSVRNEADAALRENSEKVAREKSRSRSRERTQQLKHEDEEATQAFHALRAKRDEAKVKAQQRATQDRQLRRSSSWSERVQAQRAVLLQNAEGRVSRLESKARDLPIYTPGRKSPLRHEPSDNDDEEDDSANTTVHEM